jgi:hypothetical protein
MIFFLRFRICIRWFVLHAKSLLAELQVNQTECNRER